MNSTRLQLVIFLAVAALSLGAGALFERADAPLELHCSGRSAQVFPHQGKTHWLLNQYDLDLRAEGQGDYKTNSRLFDDASSPPLGYLHRTAGFSQRREGQRLLIQVLHSGKSQTDNLQEAQLSSLGLFVFTEQLRLSFRLRQLAHGSLLIDNGQGAVLLCVQAPPGA